MVQKKLKYLKKISDQNLLDYHFNPNVFFCGIAQRKFLIRFQLCRKSQLISNKSFLKQLKKKNWPPPFIDCQVDESSSDLILEIKIKADSRKCTVFNKGFDRQRFGRQTFRYNQLICVGGWLAGCIVIACVRCRSIIALNKF